MQVFRAYFKIILKNLPQMMIYLVVFLSLSIMFASLGVGGTISGFEESRPRVALFLEDDSVLVRGFADYLAAGTTIVPVKDDVYAIRDALFYRDAVYMIRIPEGFTERLIAGEDPVMTRETVPDSIYTAYMDRLVDSYFEFAGAYFAFEPGVTQEKVVSQVAEDLRKEAPVTVVGKSGAVQKDKLGNSVYFFNYFAYSLFAIILLGMSSFMLTFSEPDLKRRNNASPLSQSSMNAQLIAANVVFAAAVWAILFVTSFFVFGPGLFDPIILYYGVNTLTYTIVCVAISFTVGSVVKGRGALAAVVNILALGLSFLTGVFVPQEMLSDTVLKIGSFTPTYWYVRANRIINAGGSGPALFSGMIAKELAMQILFIAILFALAIFIRRRKLQEEN